MNFGLRSHLIILISLYSLSAFAGDNFSKIHVYQIYYSGKDEKTFSNDNPGAGLEISVSTVNERYNWIAKTRLTTISGSQDFNDGGTSRSSDFTFYQGSFEGGGVMYPLGKKKRAFNLYFGLTAVFSLNHLQLESSSLTVLEPAYQSMSFGYSGLVGIEWFISDSWAISAEFAQRNETTSLAKQSAFDLGGFSLAFGVGW